MITNLRDIGGYTGDKGILKSGYFFRSGELVNLSQEDKDYLAKECKIKKVFDFRSQQEITSEPDSSISGIEIENIDILASAVEKSASVQDMLLHSQDIEEEMITTYKNIVMCDSAKKGYKTFLEEILSLKEPILFHCFAGKDRTGFAAALILKIAGISDNDIMKDYLKTNAERKVANQELIDKLKPQLSSEQLKALPVALTVESKYLMAAKDEIIKNYKTFDNYLVEGLQLEKDYASEFRNAFILNSLGDKND